MFLSGWVTVEEWEDLEREGDSITEKARERKATEGGENRYTPPFEREERERRRQPARTTERERPSAPVREGERRWGWESWPPSPLLSSPLLPPSSLLQELVCRSGGGYCVTEATWAMSPSLRKAGSRREVSSLSLSACWSARRVVCLQRRLSPSWAGHGVASVCVWGSRHVGVPLHGRVHEPCLVLVWRFTECACVCLCASAGEAAAFRLVSIISHCTALTCRTTTFDGVFCTCLHSSWCIMLGLSRLWWCFIYLISSLRLESMLCFSLSLDCKGCCIQIDTHSTQVKVNVTSTWEAAIGVLMGSRIIQPGCPALFQFCFSVLLLVKTYEWVPCGFPIYPSISIHADRDVQHPTQI